MKIWSSTCSPVCEVVFTVHALLADSLFCPLRRSGTHRPCSNRFRQSPHEKPHGSRSGAESVLFHGFLGRLDQLLAHERQQFFQTTELRRSTTLNMLDTPLEAAGFGVGG